MVVEVVGLGRGWAVVENQRGHLEAGLAVAKVVARVVTKEVARVVARVVVKSEGWVEGWVEVGAGVMAREAEGWGEGHMQHVAALW
jgi:hypothetical protein